MCKNRLSYFRVRNNLTQSELANIVGCSQNTISSIETGVYGCSVSLALLLASALHIKVEDLFYYE